MKITCLLTSYNRPRLVRQSLRSIAQQSHKDYELIVLDESSIFDIRRVTSDFVFSDIRVEHFAVPAAARRTQNRLSIKINVGLSMAKGDLICYLCDDDYYYPDWFKKASEFFEANSNVSVGFGALSYTPSMDMVFPTDGPRLFHESVVLNPMNMLDHNQVIHRRFIPPIVWPERMDTLSGPDAYYFRDVSGRYPFHPIKHFAAVKRVHPKNLQSTIDHYVSGGAEGPRE